MYEYVHVHIHACMHVVCMTQGMAGINLEAFISFMTLELCLQLHVLQVTQGRIQDYGKGGAQGGVINLITSV